jgi:small conductance mechanosensitive channel
MFQVTDLSTMPQGMFFEIPMDTQLLLEWLAQSGLRILLILIIAFVAFRLLSLLAQYVSRHIKDLDEIDHSELDKRTETILSVVNSTGLVLIVGTALLMVLTTLGVPIAPVLASVGFVGLALGLGAQTLVEDMISGLFILSENQYVVGDTIQIGSLLGTVEEMTLRATMIRDVTGGLHIVPNGEIRIVSNKSRQWSRAMVDINIPYEEDVELALRTLDEIGAALSQDEVHGPLLLEPPVVTGVEGLDDWAIRLRLMVKTQPDQHLSVQRYLRRRIHLVFEEKGIGLAFPRQDVMLLPSDG